MINELDEDIAVNGKPDVVPVLNISQCVFAHVLKLVAVVPEGNLAYYVDDYDENAQEWPSVQIAAHIYQRR